MKKTKALVAAANEVLKDIHAYCYGVVPRELYESMVVSVSIWRDYDYRYSEQSAAMDESRWEFQAYRQEFFAIFHGKKGFETERNLNRLVDCAWLLVNILSGRGIRKAIEQLNLVWEKWLEVRGSVPKASQNPRKKKRVHAKRKKSC